MRSAKYGVSVSKTLSDRAADQLREVLHDERVSISELSRRLEVSVTYVWRRVHGKASLSFDEVERIAAALGVPTDRLVPEPIEVAA